VRPLSRESLASLRGEVEQVFFRGRPYENEVVFFHRASRTLIMCDLSVSRILDAMRVVTNHGLRSGVCFRTPPDYDTDQVSKKVLRIIMSYVEYVRRTVWFDSDVPA